MVDAVESQGFTLKIGNGADPEVFIDVEGITGWSAFDGSASEIDTTTTLSTAKEFIMGLQDWGSFSVDTNWLGDDDAPGQAAMRAAKASRQKISFEAHFANDVVASFAGFVVSAPNSGGVDGKVEGSFNIRITGDVEFA